MTATVAGPAWDPTRPGEPLLDAHVHLWSLARRPQPWIDASRAAIHRDFTTADLEAVLDDAGVDAAVLVQVLNDAAESDDLADAARDCPRIAGLVGWVDLTAADVADRCAALDDRCVGRLVGVRHQGLAEPDPAGWLLRDDVGRGLAAVGALGLAVDVMVGAEHLPAVAHVVGAHPGVRFVVDHLGKPPIASGALEPWAGRIRALAARENCTVKLSGMVTMADWRGWTVADLRPYADVVLDAFGADRVMVGSDWPVSLVSAGYGDVVGAARELVAGLSPAERRRVCAGTAREVYRLL